MDMHNTLWQSIAKKHMESMTGKTISDEEWEDFVSNVEGAFADEVSMLACEFWWHYDQRRRNEDDLQDEEE